MNVRGSGPELERQWPLTEIKKQTFQILNQCLKGKWLEERTQRQEKERENEIKKERYAHQGRIAPKIRDLEGRVGGCLRRQDALLGHSLWCC